MKPILLLLAACIGHAAAAQRTFLDTAAFDRSVAPGDDFYAFANGGWLKRNEIPPTETAWGAATIAGRQVKQRLEAVLTSLAAEKQAAGSNAHKLAVFYSSGLDTVAIERAGMAPVASDLAGIEAIRTGTDLVDAVIRQYTTGLVGIPSPFRNSITPVPPLFVISNFPDQLTNELELVTLQQGGMGMPEKSYYFDTSPKATGIRNRYRGYVQTLLERSGLPAAEAAASADAVLALETRLAAGARTATQNRDRPKLLNVFSTEQVDQRYPQLGWGRMAKALGLYGARLFVYQPEFFDTLNRELSATPVPVWKAYLRVRLLSNAAPYLSSPFANAYFDFYKTALTGQATMRSRQEEVVNIVEDLTGELLAEAYMQRYFPAGAKRRIDDLVANIVTTFGERIAGNTWLTEETKKNALLKLSTLKRKIAHPDHWRDYRGLRFGTSFFENVRAATLFDFRFNADLTGKPVNRDMWVMTPTRQNAYYNAFNNEIVFGAGLLLPPFFDAEADDAVNYGAIATIIGHEISHGFDLRGSQYDEKGRYRNWWSQADREQFEAKGAALAAQYDRYVVIDSLRVNGKLTLTENISDLCGLIVAYEAFRKTPQGRSNKKIDGLTPDQRFFLASAAKFRRHQRPESLRTQVLTDPHAPGKFRANGPLSNFPAFYAAFGIKPGDAMWRPEGERVLMW
ncbi:M13 family metallopeptidase [Flaviaesturariibacter amylovorans]|uniref:M13 family peptidase n=1 Tax=Flaviaesturariibacter amylovorans TaxID=1084520 RepID=A0ABP8G4V8_9BACT